MSVKVIDISKKFSIGSNNRGALPRLVNFISGRELKKEIEVLRNVSFEIFSGEIVGLIGKNGSGKSTLLRIIAGIYHPDSGQVLTSGRVYYLSGVNSGLSLRLNMKDNIFLMSSMLGLSRKQITKNFDEIVEFSGLSDFTNAKVYQFSSGMMMRLGFSTTMYCLKELDPNVLLLDEIFSSGGDIDFDKKASKKMSEFINGGAAVVLASHDLSAIENYCHKVLCLSGGNISEEGDPIKAIGKYKKLKA